MNSYQQLLTELERHTNEQQATFNKRFFKTGKGEYGEGDRFLGITVPVMRRIAKKYHLALPALQRLLNSPVHEFRFCGLCILIDTYKHAAIPKKKSIFDFYIKNAKRVNNWDLVDCSAPHIVGDYLADKNRSILKKLAQSTNLWERRIAIVATLRFIRDNDFTDCLAVSTLLLHDKHDLIHKATGWMLREVGKRDQKTLETFLDAHAATMPRTMLRYAIERLPEKKRQSYLVCY